MNFHCYSHIETVDKSKAVVGDVYYDMARNKCFMWHSSGWMELSIGEQIFIADGIIKEEEKVSPVEPQRSEDIEIDNWEDMSWEELIEKWEEIEG